MWVGFTQPSPLDISVCKWIDMALVSDCSWRTWDGPWWSQGGQGGLSERVVCCCLCLAFLREPGKLVDAVLVWAG